MPTLEEVYQKFGFASEAAQLLETELGNLLLTSGAVAAGLLENPDPARAADFLTFVNKQTLGQLLKNLKRSTDSLEQLETQLTRALTERNKLFHCFYREHNFRTNSEDGRALMMKDLESIHNVILDAYKAVMLLSGVDLDRVTLSGLPTQHLRI